jgi:hypothetical protein
MEPNEQTTRDAANELACATLPAGTWTVRGYGGWMTFTEEKTGKVLGFNDLDWKTPDSAQHPTPNPG